MDIKTKFDIYQLVYFMEDNKINMGRISNIQANVYTGDVISITYTVSKTKGQPNTNVKQETLYATKEYLLDHLIK
jgi:hypothetical protein